MARPCISMGHLGLQRLAAAHCATGWPITSHMHVHHAAAGSYIIMSIALYMLVPPLVRRAATKLKDQVYFILDISSQAELCAGLCMHFRRMQLCLCWPLWICTGLSQHQHQQQAPPAGCAAAILGPSSAQQGCSTCTRVCMMSAPA